MNVNVLESEPIWKHSELNQSKWNRSRKEIILRLFLLPWQLLLPPRACLLDSLVLGTLTPLWLPLTWRRVARVYRKWKKALDQESGNLGPVSILQLARLSPLGNSLNLSGYLIHQMNAIALTLKITWGLGEDWVRKNMGSHVVSYPWIVRELVTLAH